MKRILPLLILCAACTDHPAVRPQPEPEPAAEHGVYFTAPAQPEILLAGEDYTLSVEICLSLIHISEPTRPY